jgi:hypothetical protein
MMVTADAYVPADAALPREEQRTVNTAAAACLAI